MTEKIITSLIQIDILKEIKNNFICTMNEIQPNKHSTYLDLEKFYQLKEMAIDHMQDAVVLATGAITL